MTPPEKPGSTGQNTEREPDHKSGVATDGQAKPVDQAAGGNNDRGHEGNGKSGTSSSDGPTARVATSEDLELSHGTPPPWQRVTSDNSPPASQATTQPTSSQTTKPTSSQTTQPTTSKPAATPGLGSQLPPPVPMVPNAPAKPSPPPQPPVAPPTPVTPPSGESMPPNPPPHGEKTVSIERPVVTGAAAARLFADGGMPTAATVPAPGIGMPHGGAAPARTTVHLEGSVPAVTGPSTGPLRVGAAATPSALRRPGRGPRRANLQIKRFDPWSVLKLSLVLGVALFFVWLVAVGVMYAVLDGMGVWDKLNGISSEILQPTDEAGGEPLISAGRVFGVAAIIGAVNIVLFSALSTVGAFIYNVSADLAGGLEVTLAERE